MKKTFYLIFLLIPIFIFAQDLEISQFGLHGPDGPGDDNILYGQTVTITATTGETIDIANFGFQVDETVNDRARVYYYSAAIPTSGTYLGYIDHSVVGKSGDTTKILGTFTLLEYSSGTAKSIQVMTGIWYNDPLPQFGTRICSYITQTDGTGTYTGLDNPPSTSWFSYLNNNDNPLPATLSSFTAEYSNGYPLLSWTTQSESNNAYWNIYRSISQNIGQATMLNIDEEIYGAGTTSEPTDYTYIDRYGVEENTTYYYWIESVDYNGETETFGPVSLFIPYGGSNQGTPVTPDDYGLKQNYPNPFNPDTKINFALEEDSTVQLIIYNIKGEKIKTIFDGFVSADMIQTKYWDGKDENGKYVASGVYLYCLRTNKLDYNKSMLLMK